MLQEQINALIAREIGIERDVQEAEEKIKSLKNALTVTRKAIKSLQRYEEQLNETEGFDPSPTPEQPVLLYQ